MELTLYFNFSKKKNSTKRPESTGGVVGLTMTANLKRPTSVESPVFLLEGDDDYLNATYIKWNNAYYFVNDIVCVRDRLFEFHCSMDALATNKEVISNYTCYVERSSSNYNLSMHDSTVSNTQDIIENRSATTQIPIFNDQFISTYLIRMVGGDGTRNGNAITNFLTNNLTDFGPIFNPDTYFPNDEGEGGLTGELLSAIKGMTRVFFDPFKYVIGVYRTPIALGVFRSTIDPDGYDEEPVMIKWFDSGVKSRKMKNKTYGSELTIIKPDRYYGDWRDASNSFVAYNIYLPSVGVQTIPSEYMTSPIKVKYNIDLETGDIFYRLMNRDVDGSNWSTIANYNGNIYAKVQIGQQSVNASSILGSVGQIATSGALGNVGGVVTGLTNGIQNATAPMPSLNGSQTSAISIYAQPHIIVNALIHGSGAVPSTTEGRPLCQNMKLGDLSGFIKCSGASIDIDSYGTEKDTVNNYLNGGFYYE